MAGTKTLRVVITGNVGDALQSFDTLDDHAGRTGDSIGAKFAKVGGLIAVGVGAGVVAAAVGLFKLGESFDEQFDKIRTGTGLTGKALEGLEGDFKKVVQQVPTDFNSAGDAVTGLNQKLGLTGEPLQKIADQFLEVSRITKTDLSANLKEGTDVLNQFGITGKGQRTVLDQMFRASQASGLGFTDLLTRVGSAGTVLRAAGFDVQHTTAFVASLGKAGIDVADVMPALSKSLATAAKDGKDAGQLLGETFGRIKDAPDDIAAAQIAMEIFGAKSGPKFAELIREGKISYEDMLGVVTSGKDTINKASLQTQDFSEKWQMFKNKALVALEPVATRVFAALGVAMDKLPGIIAKVRAFAEENWPKVYEPAKAGVDWIMTNVWPRLVQGFEYVKGQVENLVAFFSERWEKIKEATRNVVAVLGVVFLPLILVIQSIWDHIGGIIDAAWQYIRGVVKAGVDAIRGIIDIVLGILTLDFDQAWQGIKELIGAAWEGIKATIGLALDMIKLGISIAWDTIKGLAAVAWDLIKEAISAAWDKIKELVAGAVGWVKDQISGAWDTIRDTAAGAWDTIKGVISGAWDGIKDVASSGVDAVVDLIRGLPGRVLDFVGDMLNAGKSLGRAVIDGLKDGMSEVAGFAGDVADAILGAFKNGWNAAANAVNDFIPDKISLPGPIPDIDLPDNPIPRFHSGIDRVPGRPGEEVLAILQAGERVVPASQNRPGMGVDASSLDGAAAALVDAARALIQAAAAHSGQLSRHEVQRLVRSS